MTADELKERARTLERAGKLAEARDAYVAVLESGDSESSGADWVTLGELQRQMAELQAAAASYGHAVDAFVEGGLRNNAIAACHSLLALAPDDESALARLAGLAIEQGYRRLARSSTERSILAGLQAGDLTHAARLAASFAERFPTDTEVWADWTEELLARGGDAGAREALDAFHQALAAAGSTAAAGRVRDQLNRLGNGGSQPTSTPAPATAGDADLHHDFIGPGPAAAVPDTDGAEVGQLPGLETTHFDLASDRVEGFEATRLVDFEPGSGDDAATEPADDLPLLEDSSLSTSAAAVGEADDLELDTGRYPSLQVESFDELQPPEDLGVIEPADELEFLRPPHDADARGSPRDEQEPGIPPDESPALQDLPALPGSVSPAPPDRLETAEVPPAEEGEPLPFLDESPSKAPLDLDAIRREIVSVTTREVEPADPATHYDLGVAFKEMGLLEESIAQLGQAIGAGFNPLASLEVLGEILSDRGDHESAARILRLATANGAAPDAELVGALYWLARSEDALGNREEAQRLFRRVIAVDPAFRDASTRIGGSGR